ncbi:immunoglobulin superfamily member 1-like [Phasianus colchicus]|uniref:immunoglobulin superfamily member 1-like n=1 Tax=Phasianus colchicus TaxID=9054 RepID=UPI00129EB79D|nr:immunoglobulin superfamily member 1-like [Phasianus colchicus]
MALAIILGWWLVAASRAQHLSPVLVLRPSLSLHPSQGVSLGDTVTLRCHLPQSAARVWLYKKGRWTYSNYKYKVQDTADFSFLSTNREHAGTYWCQYRVPWSAMVSERSDAVELVLTDRSFPPPSISLSPEECVEMGTNVTIQCWNKDYGAAFLLHNPDPTGAADSSHGNLVVAVAGGCTAAFVFILVFVVFFLLTAQRRRIRRDECPGTPAERPEDMEFQVPSSDSEGLTYMEQQAVTPSTQPLNPPADPQPSVIYAEVAVGRHH